MSCICENCILGLRSNFATMDVRRFSRWTVIDLLSTFCALCRRVTLNACRGWLCEERQLLITSIAESKVAAS